MKDIMIEWHESRPLTVEDFEERNRCDKCHRIPGTIFPGAMGLGEINCLRCMAASETNPSQFMMDQLKIMNPIAADMATKYKDEFFEDKK